MLGKLIQIVDDAGIGRLAHPGLAALGARQKITPDLIGHTRGRQKRLSA